MKPETAFIYRRGLAKADLLKETLNVTVTNEIKIGAKPDDPSAKTSDVQSMSSVIGDLITLRQKQEGAAPYSTTLYPAFQDAFTAIREKLADPKSADAMTGINRACNTENLTNVSTSFRTFPHHVFTA